jgi:hypothetical protein
MTDGGIFQDLAHYIHASKETLDLLKVAIGLLSCSLCELGDLGWNCMGPD